MATNISRRVHKIDDLALLQTFYDFQALFPDAAPTVRLTLAPSISLELGEIEEPSELAGRYAFGQATFNVRLDPQTNFAAHFYRSVKVGNERTPSATFDEFEFSFGNEPNHWQDKKDKITAIMAIVGNLDLPGPQGEPTDEEGTLRELLVGFGATHRHMLDSLNEAIKANEKKRAEIEKTFEEKENKRVEAHKQALEELESERAKLRLQSHKSESRRIMQAMTDSEAVNLRKALTPRPAVYARWGVFFAAVLLSALAGALAFSSITQLGADEALTQQILDRLSGGVETDTVRQAISDVLGPTNWFLIGRSIVSSLVAIGGLVYAAGWLRSFYNAEVNSAKEIDRFNYDLVRASWAIETILQVQNEYGGEVPQEWIEGVTRGLFDSSGKGEDLDKDAQALRALLGFTAAASFGPEGPKFEIGRKDAKKLAKAGEQEPST